MNDEHLYASYLEAGADGLDSTALDSERGDRCGGAR